MLNNESTSVKADVSSSVTMIRSAVTTIIALVLLLLLCVAL
jgi:hypothetical protein